MGLVRTMGARIGSWLVGTSAARFLLRKFGTRALSLLPEATLVPLRRDGMEPVAELDRMREEQPVTKLPVPFGVNIWLVTGYAENKQVLVDTASFSNDYRHLGELVEIEDQNPGGLGFADPPDHTRLRKLLTPEFTMRRLARLGPRIDAIVADCLDRIATAPGPIDLVELFALPIPSLTICELLGVPYSDRDDFQRLAVARFDLFSGAGASLGAISESLVYLEGIVRAQRADPGDGLLGMIIREHGDEVDDKELAGLADGILTGGFETTASMLALGAVILLRDPDTATLIRHDDKAIGPFVEELLRYLTVVQVAFPRFARHDLRIGDTEIGKGDLVVCSLSSANRDDALGVDIRTFDPRRRPTQHMAFGYGAHRCIGAELARMELRAAYPALVRRFPNLKLAKPEDSLEYRKTSIVYGVEQIPVTTA
ncbi:cytochrome P450 [Actinokineospora sp. NBRC 105648]|uniref:cytochrome P450 n=1 Tax=Actinokineospora sp. NBRC 105648 TaxID=3032206 RepID=UPI0024A5DDF9|nr:cytochrome P450 [Actinokineospora sp. NBRC 105648]GLZ36491.1 cytochrome P450 [Actinokineospora sp. NBRC 105648]